MDILNFEDLKQFQSFCAIPYAGECGVLLGPPFGWVVDAGICQEMPALAALYQRGCTFQEANQASEFMYINFWDRKKENDNLDSYIQKDDRRLSEHYKKACEYIDTITRPDKQQTKLRKINIQKNLVEYTGFVEFEEFIFFCVLITPTLLEKRNVRKLEYIIESVIPIKLTHQNLNTMKEPFDAKAPATT